MAKSRVERTKHNTNSEHRENFRDPATVPLTKQAPTTLKMEESSRGGVDKTLLFNHGPNIFDAVVPVSFLQAAPS